MVTTCKRPVTFLMSPAAVEQPGEVKLEGGKNGVLLGSTPSTRYAVSRP